MYINREQLIADIQALCREKRTAPTHQTVRVSEVLTLLDACTGFSYPPTGFEAIRVSGKLLQALWAKHWTGYGEYNPGLTLEGIVVGRTPNTHGARVDVYFNNEYLHGMESIAAVDLN